MLPQCYDALQTWGPKPDLDTYVGLMAVCARDGDAARAMALRREMEDGGVEVMGEVLRAVMAMQRHTGLWEAAVETFREMQTKAVFSTDADTSPPMLQLLSEVTESGCVDPEVFNLLIETSLPCYEGMQRWGPKPDLETYQGLMAVCARDGDAAKAMKLKKGMEDGRVEVMGEVLRALMALQRQIGMWKSAVETLKEMRAKAELLTEAIEKGDAARAMASKKGMEDGRVEVTEEVLRALLAMQRKAGLWEAPVETLKEMQAKGVMEDDTAWGRRELVMEAIEKGSPNAETFNLAIAASLQVLSPASLLPAKH
ncbi:unnamed protein product [Closterium sp. NIES-65]|nr:unnamed protein product [Closterium sp. NIES-65]